MSPVLGSPVSSALLEQLTAIERAADRIEHGGGRRMCTICA
jgi:hypothetical protein